MSLPEPIADNLTALRPDRLFHRVESALRDYPDIDTEVVLAVPEAMMAWLNEQIAVREFILASVRAFAASNSEMHTAPTRKVVAVFEINRGIREVAVTVRPSTKAVDIVRHGPTTTQKVLIVCEGRAIGTALWWQDSRKPRKPHSDELAPIPQFWDSAQEGLERFITDNSQPGIWQPGTVQRIFGVEVLYDEVSA